VSGWELWERRGREEERRAETEELGAGGEEQLLFLCNFLAALLLSWGWVEGKGELAIRQIVCTSR